MFIFSNILPDKSQFICENVNAVTPYYVQKL